MKTRRRRSKHSTPPKRNPLAAFGSWLWSHKKKFFVLLGITLAIFAIIGAVTWAVFATTLSSKESVMNRTKTGVTLLDRHGNTFYEFYNAHSNTFVPLAQIAPFVQKALIAAEDKDFYKHPGFSISGIAKAIYTNLIPGGSESGGSTITQQLVKNALLTQDRNILRKYQELILSVEIERRYSKDEILEMYLNSVYFGEGTFGIEDAGKEYFGKSAKDLNLAEASMLIGLLPAPSAYSPLSGNATFAAQRQAYVLGRMRADGYISAAEADAVAHQTLSYNTQAIPTNVKAPHFALMVKAELEQQYGQETIARSGYKVKTTLNIDWQSKAESAVAEQVDKLSASKVSNGSAVAIDPKTGEILVLVGSKDWNNTEFGKVNIATSARQPGSSFKPIVYATGIEQRQLTAATIFDDKLTNFNGYQPRNYTGRFYGPVSLRFALSNSLNIPAVLALQKIGIPSVLSQAKALGITTLTDTPDQYGLPLALGSGQVKLLELTNAFATFANAGKHAGLQSILSIEDKNNKEIFSAKPKTSTAISDQTAFIISSILSDNNARASTFGNSLRLTGGRLAAVKTGTTEDYRDALTVGYTPSLAIGVWIGNNDNTPMSAVAGSSGSGPIWRQLMQQFLDGTPNEQFKLPSGVVSQPICRGQEAIAATTGDNTYLEYFRQSNIPTARCNVAEEKQAEQTETPSNSTNTTDSTGQTSPGNGEGNNNADNKPPIIPPGLPTVNP